MITENLVVCDIETWVKGKGGKPDPEKDILRFIGFRAKSGKKGWFFWHETEKIQRVLDYFDFIGGHNFSEYDAIILKRHGFKLPKVIDTLSIIDKRAKTMMYLDFSMGQRSLRYLLNFFDLRTQKGDIDYDIFKKDEWTDEEITEIEHYLYDDLDGSWDLLEYLYNFFVGFKDMMSAKDKRNMSWLTTSSGTNAYKIMCNMAGIKEEYNDNATMGNKDYQGAYVALPYKDFVEGDIKCSDWASLYPHMYLLGNLFSPTKGDGWSGEGMFQNIKFNPEDGLSGTYSTEMGKIEKVILNVYNLRVAVKKELKEETLTDARRQMLSRKELAYKIFINSCYGVSGSPIFKNLYNRQTASDCTAMARMSIKHARAYLTQHGYECLYTDTDSVYYLDPYEDDKRALRTCQDISDIQVGSANIPIESHFFEIEDKIKRMYFFRDDGGKFVKKLYLYVKENDSITLKGLQLVKGNCSELTKIVYEKYIKPLIQEGKEVVHTTAEISQMYYSEVKDNLDAIAKRFRVNQPESYANDTSIQSRLAKEYGAGEHYLICNFTTGVGQGVKYATKEELEVEHGDDWVNQIDLRKSIGELRHFIDWKDRKKIFLIGMDHTCKSFSVLDNLEPDEGNFSKELVQCRSCNKVTTRYKEKKSKKWIYN